MTIGSETFWLIVTLFVAGTVATDVWRLGGVFLARGLKPQSQLVVWIKDVSTALLAGLVARLVFFPPDALAQVPMLIRTGAFASALLVYFLSGGQVVLSLAYGLGVLLVAQWAFGVG
jgi:hypothetical protein